MEYILPGVPNPKSVTNENPQSGGESKEESGQAAKTSVEVRTVMKKQVVTILHDDKVQKEKLDSFVRQEKGDKIFKLKKELADIEDQKEKMETVFLEKNEAVPQFDAMGLVTEQGDTDVSETLPPVTENRRVAVNREPSRTFTQEFQPRPMNTEPVVETIAKPVKTASAATGAWSVQVGAFSTHDAGISALQTTRGKLPDHVAGGSQYLIAPLMTNRGMIYRARLSGMAREQATQLRWPR